MPYSNRGIKPLLLQLGFFPSRAKRVLRPKLKRSDRGHLSNRLTFATPLSRANTRLAEGEGSVPAYLMPIALWN